MDSHFPLQLLTHCHSQWFCLTQHEQIYKNKKNRLIIQKQLTKQLVNNDGTVYLVEEKDAHNCEFRSLTKFPVSTFVGHKHCEEL